MAYDFKKNKLNGVVFDRENVDFASSQKIKNANSAYGGDVIPDFNPNQAVQNVIEREGIKQIPLDNIKERHTNEFKTISNKTLEKSILEVGLINPIIVRKSDNDKYIIISGHRRFDAFKAIKKKFEVEKLNGKNVDNLLEHFKMIPAIVFEVVDEQSDLYGTDPKYITSSQEEKMYEASNLESRQIGTTDLTKHINYFYELINNDKEYKKELLEKINETATRKATKLNMPRAVSMVITEELGFNVSPTYIWQLITIKESGNDYPAYQKIALKRIEDGEKVNTVYKDFDMARQIYLDEEIEKVVKDEYKTRIEKGNEPIKNIYNEAYNIKIKSREKKEKMEDFVIRLLKEVKNKRITIDNAIEKFNDYLSC